MRNIKIAPSILSADFSILADEVKRMDKAGADLLHCDAMDGIFVPNITFGPKVIADIRKHTQLQLDVHLMITQPERYVNTFVDAGADILTIHVEATQCLIATLKAIKSRGIKCGAVISPDTEVAQIRDAIEYSDMVLLMSVYPGFGGQKFIEKSLSRLRELVELVRMSGKQVDIEIDGGVTTENIVDIVGCGANIIVAGNTVFGSQDPKSTMNALRNCQHSKGNKQ